MNDLVRESKTDKLPVEIKCGRVELVEVTKFNYFPTIASDVEQ